MPKARSVKKHSRTKRGKTLRATLAAKQKQKFDDAGCSNANLSSTLENVFPDGTANNQKDECTDIRNAWGTDEDFASIMEEQLQTERTPCESIISGNRIVDIAHLLQTTIAISEAHARKCTSGNLFIHEEKKQGLQSIILLKCNTCEKIFSTSTEKTSDAIINKATVWGTISTGSTFKHTEEFLSVLNIPSISSSRFYNIQEELSELWSQSAWRNMEVAGVEERRLAIENGQINNDGVPWITVYLDGGWSKRSYGHNYNAASGVGVIIGRNTKKVLFMAVRNKYCCICARNEKKEIKISHKCFKNWQGSSSAMEADIIVEGFEKSMKMHGVKFLKFIADGDSSVLHKIQTTVSYGNEVFKIECTNHVIKNYGKRLHKIKTDTQNVSLAARKLLTNNIISDLQKIAQRAIYDNAHGDINSLIEDITNGPDHIFGNHIRCKSYYCQYATEDIEVENSLANFHASGLYRIVQGALNPVLRKVNSLIDNETNNRAELFMSILNRFNMGKRLNLIQRHSFNIRSDLTTLRYNEGVSWHYNAWKDATERSPGKFYKKFITSETANKNKRKPQKKQKKDQAKKKVVRNLDYGTNCIDPLSTDQIADECERILKSFEITKERKYTIAVDTVGQFDNTLYRFERKHRLTASNFGSVIKRRDHTPCHNLVKSILHPQNFCTPAIEYGKMNESIAIALFMDETNLIVKPSGLHIDLVHPFLAASPDGLIGDDSIVEVKCIYTLAKLNLSLTEASKTMNLCVEFKDGKLNLKRNHNYFFQVQGQLHITERRFCYFIVFTNSKSPIFFEKIEKCDDFWYTHMMEKLVRFYKYCMLPEIVRGNIGKGLKCVDPEYILNAQALQKIKK